MSLTDKRLRFVEEYLLDLCATKAAIRAGYSEKSAYSTAHDLLNDPDVIEAIDAAMNDRSKRVGVSQDYVVRNLVQVVERCMQAEPVMVRRGKEMVQLEDEEGRDVWQFDAKGANGALSLLGKHLGMYVEKKEITLPQGGGVLAVPIPVDAAQWAAGAAKQQADLTAKPETAERSEDGA